MERQFTVLFHSSAAYAEGQLRVGTCCFLLANISATNKRAASAGNLRLTEAKYLPPDASAYGEVRPESDVPVIAGNVLDAALNRSFSSNLSLVLPPDTNRSLTVGNSR